MAEVAQGSLTEEPAADQPPAEDYGVGHCRPPLATRFRKGQSGNPSGRPKGSKNTRMLLQEKLGEKVKVRLPDGRTRKISKREVGLTKLVNRFAETGDLKTFELLMKLEGTRASPDASYVPSPHDGEEITPTGRSMLDWYVEMRKSETEPSDA